MRNDYYQPLLPNVLAPEDQARIDLITTIIQAALDEHSRIWDEERSKLLTAQGIKPD